MLDAAERRQRHTAIWSGRAMIVWGGFAGFPLDTGGIYDPALDAWTETTKIGAPAPRWDHSAVWSGSFMLVWGGGAFLSSGGRYATGHALDDDGDGLSECGGDCDDGRATVFPGAAQICDGINNDCADPSWPILPPAEGDADGDGFMACGGDCDDADPSTHPGAPETNDGRDNQCPGEPGSGSVDEISGDCGFHDPDDPTLYSWPPQPGASAYRIARSPVPDFSSGCVVFDAAAAIWIDPDPPPLSGAHYYLVRSIAPLAGSWGTDSTGRERAPACP